MIDDFFYRTLMYIEETAKSIHRAWGLIRLVMLSSNIGWIYEEFERKLEEAAKFLEDLLGTVVGLYVQYTGV